MMIIDVCLNKVRLDSNYNHCSWPDDSLTINVTIKALLVQDVVKICIIATKNIKSFVTIIHDVNNIFK